MAFQEQLDVVKRIDRNELAGLTKELVDIPSPTGSERALGEFILAWFARHGIKTVRQEISSERINAIGIIEGKANGVSLTINGHMDTSYTGTEEDRMFCRALEPDSDLRGAVRDGKVFGLGASNMKSGLAAFMVAGKVIRESGLALKGDLILAAVAGEISRTPVGSYQSEAYRGEGTGTQHLLTHGMQSDYAIVADRSGHSIVWAQNGVAQFKISTFGDPHAAWGVTRAEKSPEASSAILKMIKVLQTVDTWAAEFERAHVYASPHGPLVPKVNIGSIQGGAPFRPNYYPGVCSIYVDVRTPPGLRPTEVQRELKAALAKTGVEYEIEMYASKMGYEAKGAGAVVNVIETTYQSLFAKKTPAPTGVHASIWTDTNIYNEMGIPACKFGLGGGRWKYRSEQIEVEDIYQAAQVYAVAALEICNWDKPR
ncbi:MAG TPA: M20/M25/M40 family metallo-hydrolase [Terriglobales bacterium]|jgi:acetylornithine deacetylase/succinyl-diaminopimelate desuccinylase-like protein|nr:M20/M25/M40 family metallo-hydrolase [Terriglobales bacterium]